MRRPYKREEAMTRWQRWRMHLALFAMVVGPGLITANVDNDAGGIATYSVAGARYGYALLWVLPPTCFLLVLVQEMCNRMGVVTGKGLSRAHPRAVRPGGLLLPDDRAGPHQHRQRHRRLRRRRRQRAHLRPPAVPRAVPVGAFLLWHIVIKGTYRTVERVFFVACIFYVTYIISGFLAKPDWGQALTSQRRAPRCSWNAPYLYMIVGIIGTTIAPWMQFYQQASVVEKGIPLKHYAYSRLDTILGAVIVTVVCYFIVLACAATLHSDAAVDDPDRRRTPRRR